MNGNVKLLGMVATASIMLASCSNDELKEVYKGEKISFTTQVKTRATETTLDNLDGFFVYAKGNGMSQMFINGQEAKKSGEGNKYTITDDKGVGYLWPSGVEQIDFWAYGPNTLDDRFKATINTQTQSFSVNLPSSMENGGADQQDFIVAHKQAKKSDISGGNIPLKFYHALSQIRVNAKCPDNGRYNVYIKGAWLMNVYGSGTLKFKESDKDESVSTAIDHMDWAISGNPTNYGAVLNSGEGHALNAQLTSLIGFDVEGTNGKETNNNLMLVPQNAQKKWTKNNTNGAYILLLCRIETIHDGTIHTDGNNTANDGPVYEEGNKHYHQTFPVSDKWKKNEYGYTCVGIDANWEPNKKYIYNLIFCGQGSGAGLYPPTSPDNLPDIDGVEVVTPPADKEVGDPILDKPLSFEVEVGDWEKVDNDTNMD